MSNFAAIFQNKKNTYNKIVMANTKKQNNTLNVEPTASQSEAFFQKYKKAIIGCVVAVVVIVAGYVIYSTYVAAPREDHASTILAKGQQYFSQQEYEKALNGDSAQYKGFNYIAKEYSSTKAGNLAKLYAGLCYAKLEKWQEAANCIESYDLGDDQMVSPAAIGALGNAYAHLNQLDKAVSTLIKAAKKADNNSLSPTFLVQAAQILESQNKPDEALKLYQEVKDKYFNSYQYQDIDKYIERVSK